VDGRDIWVTDLDRERLQKLLEGTRGWSTRDREHLERLDEELGAAHVVAAKDIPPDVVTMNSRLRLRDLDSDQEMVFTLVFPSEADVDQGKISVLAPLGTAVLGFRRGDTFEWHVPGRVRRLRVEDVLYQPEAAGDYHL
jgi:regulator of nucleoside diphosphate kinase